MFPDISACIERPPKASHHPISKKDDKICQTSYTPLPRVSFETSFDSKQLKLESKLVTLSETKHLFQLFRFYTETEIFDVSIEPEQTEDQPKQFDREHILVFFQEI
jgi:hypothetical protein